MAQIIRPADITGEPQDTTAQDDSVASAVPDSPPDDFGAALVAEFERRTDQAAAQNQEQGQDQDQDQGLTDDLSVTEHVTDSAAGDSIPPTEDSARDAKPQEPPAIAEPVAVEDLEAGDDALVHGASSPADPSTTDAATDAATTPAAPAAEPEPYPGYIWVEGDQRVDFTEDQVRQALVFSAWGQNLTEAMRDQFTRIEAGEAVAIPKADYAQYQAWRASQAADDPYGYGTDLANPVNPADPTGEIAALRAEIAALRGEPGAQPVHQPVHQPVQPVQPASPLAMAAPQAYAQNAFNSQADATVAAMTEATASYASAHNLTQAQVDDLLGQAVGMNIIPTIADSLVTRNPVTGGILSQGDPRDIIHQALDVALVRNPELFNAAHTTPASRPDDLPPQTEPPSALLDAGTDDALARKKARAGSVSSAPASTPHTSNRPVASMSRNEVTNAIAEELAAVMGGV